MGSIVANKSVFLFFYSHIPKAKATVIADTPELKRIAENTKIQSNVMYHADFEKQKGKLTQVFYRHLIGVGSILIKRLLFFVFCFLLVSRWLMIPKHCVSSRTRGSSQMWLIMVTLRRKQPWNVNERLLKLQKVAVIISVSNAWRFYLYRLFVCEQMQPV